MTKLQDKVAVITGGTKGIGLGIASEFVKEGAKVVIGGRNPETGNEGVAELEQLGGQALFVQCDVGDLDSLDNIINKAVEHFGRLDIYVANAGINDPDKTHFLDITPDQYDKIMDINLRGMFFGGQKAAKQMVKQGEGGVLINMSSVNAHLALDSQMVYTTSKGGIQQLTKVQAVALAKYNIKVNALAPGPIGTDLMRRVGSDKQLMNTILSRTPMGRIGTTNECGRLAVFLASPDSDFIFGQSIYNDGGRGFQAFPTPGYKTVTDEEYALLEGLQKEQE
ncbi:MAG: SDR family oxidoreductase [Deltaproteobacteria bacterium]|jgi:glucose 1-dehydrogenase|nr:SDR family oxidoreductase [Deltaproteobacteria bacterium]MBT4525402.1 SDR family oxidoreductase [Deltaproteobacteria bacterium]